MSQTSKNKKKRKMEEVPEDGVLLFKTAAGCAEQLR